MSKTYNFPLENKRFRRPRKNDPIFVYGAAGLLVLIGIILLIVWLVGPNKPLNKVFATKTPTPTTTSTPTLTFTPTDTPTITSTPSATSSPTPSAPYRYTVQEGDSLDKIAKDHELGDNGIRFILLLNPFDPTTGTGVDPTTQIVYPGLQLWLPYPGQPYPTSTPIPANIRPGTRIEYIVETGDTLAGIASKFNSREEDIQKLNKLDDPNAIYVGQQLIIPVNLVTPTATRPPTSTPVITGTPASSTPAVTPTP